MTNQNLGKSNLSISQVGLGTVEIGIPYGIENKLPSDKQAEHILKTAVNLGITYFDTARGYGLAEERIGKSNIRKNSNIVIGTKCAQFLEKGGDPRGKELEELIRADIEESLKALQTDSLQLVQLHGGSKEQIERGEIISIMQDLTDEGKIQNVGIAVRDNEAALAAINSNFFISVQLAHSILDQRSTTEVLPQALEKNVGIINRSVLLKGALTPAAHKLPDKLELLKENSHLANNIAEKLNIDLPTLAMRFVLSNKAITTALVGTVEPHHLETAIAAAEAGALSKDILIELAKLAIIDINQVDPSKWLPI